jgi:hypothetical protein
MSLIESKGSLSKAAKELYARWEDVKTVWSDAQSNHFEKNFLVPLEQDLRSAISALEQMDQALQKMRSDCE